MKGLKDNLYGYFVKKLGAWYYSRGWLRVPVCPSCGGHEKLGIHMSRNAVNCFRCGPKGTMYEFIMDLENLPDAGSVTKLLKGYGGISYIEPKVEPHEERQVILPEGFLSIRRGDTVYSRMARRYVSEIRKLSIDKVARKGLGYVGRRELDLFGYLIFPYYDGDRIVYYQTRRFFGIGPKFKNPKVDDFGIGKAQVIYNKNALYKYSEVNVVESVINCLTLDDNTIGTNGKHPSPKQLSDMLKSPVKIFNLMLDPDAGAEALEVAHRLLRIKPIRIVTFPEGYDVNTLGYEPTMKLLAEAPLLTSITQLNKYKNVPTDTRRYL